MARDSVLAEMGKAGTRDLMVERRYGAEIGEGKLARENMPEEGREFLEAAIEGDREALKEKWETVRTWEERSALCYAAGVSLLLPYDPARVLFSEELAVKLDFIEYLKGKCSEGWPLKEAAEMLLGLREEEEVEDMVTIKQLAREVGKSVHTVRERIYRARDEGGLRVQTVRGAILVDRAEGLRIAMERKTRGRPQRAVFSE